MTIEGNQFSDRDFRRGVWRQTATTIALLTTMSQDGQANVMACEWAMMVSHSPMHFVVSVGPRHVSHDTIEAAGEFGLSFCTDQQGNLSHISGSYSQRDTDKWSMASFPTYEAKFIRAPMIEGSLLNVECRVISTQPLGDHTVFVAEALWARYEPGTRPLIYHEGKYWSLGEQLPKE
jgi:flavin reductase (DIM6/NTAB) family NADH-FMN oxidoreductase RutF